MWVPLCTGGGGDFGRGQFRGENSKLFHRITFEDVKQFVRFDLEANDIFLLGSASYAGLPLGARALHRWPVVIVLNVNPSFIKRCGPML